MGLKQKHKSYKKDENEIPEEVNSIAEELPLQEEAELDPEQIELERQRKAQKRIYSVQNYSDSENMWEKLVNLEKC